MNWICWGGRLIKLQIWILRRPHCHNGCLADRNSLFINRWISKIWWKIDKKQVFFAEKPLKLHSHIICTGIKVFFAPKLFKQRKQCECWKTCKHCKQWNQCKQFKHYIARCYLNRWWYFFFEKVKGPLGDVFLATLYPLDDGNLGPLTDLLIFTLKLLEGSLRDNLGSCNEALLVEQHLCLVGSIQGHCGPNDHFSCCCECNPLKISLLSHFVQSQYKCQLLATISTFQQLG